MAPKDGVASAYVPAIHVFFTAVLIKQDVDARGVKREDALRAFAEA